MSYKTETRTWTVADIQYVRDFYREDGARLVARALNRTEKSVTNCARRLGIRRPRFEVVPRSGGYIEHCEPDQIAAAKAALDAERARRKKERAQEFKHMGARENRRPRWTVPVCRCLVSE